MQQELLNLMGLLGALQPGHEDRADHVVAQLGDGEHAKGAMSLVPPDVAADPDQLRAMRDRIDAQQHQRRLDQQEVEGIARASGMPAAEDGACRRTARRSSPSPGARPGWPCTHRPAALSEGAGRWCAPGPAGGRSGRLPPPPHHHHRRRGRSSPAPVIFFAVLQEGRWPPGPA
ncbi:hypothetical protein [Streptomyces sp. NPDC005859]|uniref:hypothetical protein n=1 Tax=Streptomyces sp. NPDC005859 TaxID=3157170 RepID=UPI0033DF2D6A